MRRRLLTLVLTALAAGAIARAAPPSDEPQLATGVQQVQNGDLEAAVTTLKAVAERLRDVPARSHELARAYLYLGIAQVGLNDPTAARAWFHQALALDPRFRLSASEFPPKVIAAFEAARRETRAGGGGMATPLIAGGAAAAAAGVVVLATREGGGSTSDTGAVRFTDARFAGPSIVCNNNERDASIPLAILVNATNSRSEAVAIETVTATLTIVSSPALPDEVGLVSRRAATVSPRSLDPRSTVTLRVDTTMGCSNVAGDVNRYNDWQGEVTLITPVASATVVTSDRLRVENP